MTAVRPELFHISQVSKARKLTLCWSLHSHSVEERLVVRQVNVTKGEVLVGILERARPTTRLQGTMGLHARRYGELGFRFADSLDNGHGRTESRVVSWKAL